MTLLERVTVGQQGRIVIPASIRKHLSLEAGSTLNLVLDGDSVTLSTPTSAARELQALFADAPRSPGVLASEELIAERRAEFLRELE
ncbi:MAG: AbrB/MazE/SpoVT family DNA-binding protein [Rhodoglobus sp.]|nr:AbrB/MazE/SpoVT family DNA-binding protein [Rhodoglobus sp.]